MKTREKIINGMSESELDAEYAHLRPAAGDDFEAALEALAGISWRVSVLPTLPTDS